MRISPLTLTPCLALALLSGCNHGRASFVRSDTTIGRVVIYRNGVAYFERTARVEGNTLHLSVPAERVDDFLRSLTVVDASTGQPAPVSYPSRASDAVNGLVDMKIGLLGAGPHDLKLSYVTESPAWKPSYRFVLGKPGKVELQAWAVVDNISGEDWNRVKLGVGASSALSFRYDLRSIRTVQRETLRTEDAFAVAPPTGGATLDGRQPAPTVLAELTDETITNASQSVPVSSRTGDDALAQLETSASRMRKRPMAKATVSGGSMLRTADPLPSSPAREAQQNADAARLAATALALRSTNQQYVVEGWADARDADKRAASLARANRVREQLIRNGLPADRVLAVGNGEQPGRAAGARIVQAPPAPRPEPAIAQAPDKPEDAAAKEPIGTTHFESFTTATVPRGSSAMVSVLKLDTDGEVVYFYDAESTRGNAAYPFKSVRVHNGTDSMLEAGPVTVFGEGRFVGEGIIDPVPARTTAFVPFALDRQVVVERKSAERDEISRILTVQRGVFSTEMQHIRRQTLLVTNRLDETATVYIRHTVPAGYKLVRGPKDDGRLGAAHLFRVALPAHGKVEVPIEAATPVFKTTDIRAASDLALIRAYVSTGVVDTRMKAAIESLLKLHREAADIEAQIGTVHEQMAEYRARMDELHAQIVTLKLVKTAGPLLVSLEKKMKEMSDRLSEATLKVVGLKEQQMVARVHFQDGVAELSFEKLETPAAAAATTTAPPTAG